NPEQFARNSASSVVQSLDVLRDYTAPLRHRHVGKVVTTLSKIGAVELHEKAGRSNRLILSLHDLCDSQQICGAILVVLVWIVICDRAGRNRGHEDRLVQTSGSLFQDSDVTLDRSKVLPAQLSPAGYLPNGTCGGVRKLPRFEAGYPPHRLALK